MSQETAQWLNTMTLIGFTDRRGRAWHYRASEQGAESNHYPGAIPVDDVLRRLFNWKAMSRPGFVSVPCELTDEHMFGVDDEGVPFKLIQVPDEQKIVHPHTLDVLGTFKEGYQIHDYEEWLLDQVATILDADLHISSAGLLKKGAVGWVEISMADTIDTPQGYSFRPNLLAATSLDGSLSTTYARTITSTVCDNTMSAALSERGQKVKVKHSRYSKLRMAEVRDALQVIHQQSEDFQAQLNMLESVKVTDAQWAKFVDAHVLTDSSGKQRDWKDLKGRSLTMAESKRDTLKRLYAHDMRVAPWAGTALGVVQAVNTFTHHEGIVRGADRAERNMLRAVTGGVDTLDTGTWDMLQQVLSAA